MSDQDCLSLEVCYWVNHHNVNIYIINITLHVQHIIVQLQYWLYSIMSPGGRVHE